LRRRPIRWRRRTETAAGGHLMRSADVDALRVEILPEPRRRAPAMKQVVLLPEIAATNCPAISCSAYRKSCPARRSFPAR
jgi:hypothetical protein